MCELHTSQLPFLLSPPFPTTASTDPPLFWHAKSRRIRYHRVHEFVRVVELLLLLEELRGKPFVQRAHDGSLSSQCAGHAFHQDHVKTKIGVAYQDPQSSCRQSLPNTEAGR